MGELREKVDDWVRSSETSTRDVQHVTSHTLTTISSLTHTLTTLLTQGMHLGSRAHLTALRRTQNGTQRVEQAWQLGPLLEAVTGLGLPERRKTRKGGRRAGAKRQGVGKKEGGHGAQRGKLRQDVSSLRNGVE